MTVFLFLNACTTFLGAVFYLIESYETQTQYTIANQIFREMNLFRFEIDPQETKWRLIEYRSTDLEFFL